MKKILLSLFALIMAALLCVSLISCGEEEPIENGESNMLEGHEGHAISYPDEENYVDATCLAEGSYDEVSYCYDCEVEVLREKKIIP